MKTQGVRDAVQKLLPNIPAGTVTLYVNSALDRLERKVVKKWKTEDEVCLSHEYVLKIREGVANKEMQDIALVNELQRTIADYFDAPQEPSLLGKLSTRARRVLDQFLLKKGEEFASSVANNRCVTITGNALDVIVTNDFGTHKDKTGLGETAVRGVPFGSSRGSSALWSSRSTVTSRNCGRLHPLRISSRRPQTFKRSFKKYFQKARYGSIRRFFFPSSPRLYLMKINR